MSVTITKLSMVVLKKLGYLTWFVIKINYAYIVTFVFAVNLVLQIFYPLRFYVFI